MVVPLTPGTTPDTIARAIGPVVQAKLDMNYVVDNKAEAAYRRGDLFEKRRKLMEAWAGYCAGPRGANVIAMKREA